MTEGLYYDNLDDTGLTEAGALAVLASLGKSAEPSARVMRTAEAAVDGIAYLDGICVSWAQGYGYAVTAPNRTEAGQ